MSVLSALKWRLKPIVESNVYLQSLGMRALRELPPLLPHDPDYLALRHFVRAGPPSGGLFLDVGANIGLSVLSFRRFDRRSRIYSIEPNPAHQRSLARIRRADPLFEFRIAAAGAEAGTMRLFVPFIGRLSLHTMAATSIVELERSMDAVLPRRIRAQVTVRSFVVDVVTIDALGMSPSIIKIDAEGAEPEILSGAEETLRRHRPFLMIENNPANIAASTELLAGVGYVPMVYDVPRDVLAPARGGSGESAPRNLFFVPAERCALLLLGREPSKSRDP
jgi:FkbM family methyltransferase